MAAVSGGLSGTPGDIFNDSSIQTEDEACKTTSTATSSDVLLTDLLNCDNIIETTSLSTCLHRKVLQHP